ncbi:hypothetical protein BH24ACT4_BH24ACT4_13740 [soil metagenome]
MSRPTRRLRALPLILAGLLVLGACSQQRQTPDKYGDTTRDNFQEGCVASLTEEPGDQEFAAVDVGESQPYTAERASDVCSCSYEGISNPETGIPFEQFKELNENLEEAPTPLPPEMQDIITGCVDEDPA